MLYDINRQMINEEPDYSELRELNVFAEAKDCVSSIVECNSRNAEEKS
jgi:hypothetical protein